MTIHFSELKKSALAFVASGKKWGKSIPVRLVLYCCTHTRTKLCVRVRMCVVDLNVFVFLSISMKFYCNFDMRVYTLRRTVD